MQSRLEKEGWAWIEGGASQTWEGRLGMLGQGGLKTYWVPSIPSVEGLHSAAQRPLFAFGLCYSLAV